MAKEGTPLSENDLLNLHPDQQKAIMSILIGASIDSNWEPTPEQPVQVVWGDNQGAVAIHHPQIFTDGGLRFLDYGCVVEPGGEVYFVDPSFHNSASKHVIVNTL